MLKTLISGRVSGALAVSAFALSLGLTAANEAQAVDYSGKRIRIIVPFNEGGGTDSLTRWLQPYWEKYLPGKPKLLVVNKPGAGGIVGGNYWFDRGKKDGTWVLAMSTSTVFNYLLRDPRVKFEVKDFVPIALMPRGNVIYFRKELGLAGPKTLKGKVEKLRSFPRDALVFGGKTPTSSGLNKRMALSQLGVETKDVWGMKGNGPMALAFERGEFTVNFDNTLSYLNNRKHFRKSGIAYEFFVWGAPDENGKWGRDPVWPKIPTWFEVYAAIGGKTSGGAYEATKALIKAGTGANKSFHLPKGTPADVAKAWRSATHKMLKDPSFLKAKAKVLSKYPVAVGEPAKKLIMEAIDIPPAGKAYIKAYVKKRYNLDLKI
jgi:tripartite-type tricarboxylate transporter receptor subunit TctC